MNKPLITYHLDSCQQCLKCIRVCPTEAINRKNDEIRIDENKCIHCGLCVSTCDKKGLSVENAHLSITLDLFDYTVALVPGSFFAHAKSKQEAGQMLQAIQNIGFDEVINYSDVEGALYMKSIEIAESSDELKIASFCPTINALIQKQFPMLAEQLIDLDYPVEVAAKKVRQRLEGKYARVGIYSLCDCISKKWLAKEPFGNMNSQIDYAMSIAHIFPKANRAKDKRIKEINLCREGMASVCADFYHYYQGMKSVISVSGMTSCVKALELAEFGQLDEIGLLGLFPCQSGCIGGQYLWSNPLVGRLHLDKLSPAANTPMASLEGIDVKRHIVEVDTQQETLKERMRKFNRINTILDTLPQYDCGACGYPNCRALAEAIDNGQATIADCRVRKEGGN